MMRILRAASLRKKSFNEVSGGFNRCWASSTQRASGRKMAEIGLRLFDFHNLVNFGMGMMQFRNMSTVKDKSWQEIGTNTNYAADTLAEITSYANACRSKTSKLLFEEDVTVTFEGKSYTVQVTRIQSVDELKSPVSFPLFNRKAQVEKQEAVIGRDIMLQFKSELALGILEDVVRVIALSKGAVVQLGPTGTGKTSMIHLYMKKLLERAGETDEKTGYRFSDKIILRLSKELVLGFSLLDNGEIKVDVLPYTNLDDLVKFFKDQTLYAQLKGETPPTMLLELLDGETDTISLSNCRVVIPISCHDVQKLLKVVKKGNHVSLLYEPLSEGMMVAAVTALATHSAYRSTDPFIRDFVDEQGNVKEEELVKEVRRRYAAVGGSMRDVICDEERFQTIMYEVISQASGAERASLFKNTTFENIPSDVRLLIYPKVLDKSSRKLVVNGAKNYQFDFRSELAALEVTKNVNTPEDVLALLNLNLLSPALERVVRYGLMLDPGFKAFNLSVPDGWKKESMRFYKDPLKEVLNSSHELMGEDIPKWPLCNTEITFHDTVLRADITSLQDKTLFRSLETQNKWFEFLTAQQKERLVSFWQVSLYAPSQRYTRLDTVVEPVLEGLRLLERTGDIPADEWWTVRLFYFVDGTKTKITSGWTFKESEDSKAVHIDYLNLKYKKHGVKFQGYVVMGTPFEPLTGHLVSDPSKKTAPLTSKTAVRSARKASATNKKTAASGLSVTDLAAECKRLIKKLKLKHMTALKAVVAPGWNVPSDGITEIRKSLIRLVEGSTKNVVLLKTIRTSVGGVLTEQAEGSEEKE